MPVSSRMRKGSRFLHCDRTGASEVSAVSPDTVGGGGQLSRGWAGLSLDSAVSTWASLGQLSRYRPLSEWVGGQVVSGVQCPDATQGLAHTTQGPCL